MSVLSAAHFHDEPDRLRMLVEARLWPNGPNWPAPRRRRPRLRLEGQEHAHRRPQVRPLPQAIHGQGRHDLRGQPRPAAQVAASHRPAHVVQEGHQQPPAVPHPGRVALSRPWFMGHRIREAMRDGTLGPLGGGSGTVEADETLYLMAASGRS